MQKSQTMSQTITVSISDDEAGFRLDWILAEKLKGQTRGDVCGSHTTTDPL
jgi:hypothetical protein